MEAGVYARTNAGTPQGGVISPLLANIYLHEVLDACFDQEARLRGRVTLVRYADDAVMLFAYEDDARRVMQVLPKQLPTPESRGAAEGTQCKTSGPLRLL